MPEYVAEFINVCKTYSRSLHAGKAVTALRSVSFTIKPGEIFAIVGPNRAGKTTLLKILLGLCHPSGGQVLRLGRSLRDRTTLARVGYMHENQVFPGYLTAHSLLWFYGALAGLSSGTLATRVPALLDEFRLLDRAREPIARYSKGMVQRLSLAQAVLANPELLVLDEPMEGLDLEARALLEELVGSYRRAGKAVLLVTHALADVERTCDRLAVLVGGRLVHLGSVANLVGSSGVDPAQRLEASLRQIYSLSVQE